ncbi:MAG TPA: aminotransferase class III-fold pyridoxal phosphate-dependent enzyme [Geminicoccaceae bacterium]|nr:aminotransferase class III-fold pyridoxal phosphate-dependent enzyme [Geminicoccaceae bacterium]
MTLAVGRNITLGDALADAEARYVAANPKSRARHLEAGRVLPGGNTRSILYYAPFPVTITRGEGARLFDLDGHAYLDFLGEYTAGLYGHSDPVIHAAIKQALADGIVLGAPNRFEAELARLMCARFPSLDLVRFCNSGTEANLNALSGARAATGRSHVMVFEGAYHGGMLSFAHGSSPMNVPFPYVFGRYNDLERTLGLIERHERDLAAIVIEPMMGAGGCIAAEPEFLAGLRAAASRHGIVLIFDEVMTSRLAPGGLQQKLGVIPDLTTFGKYLGGGMSFGAFGGRAEIMGRFDPSRPDAFAHSGTYNNNVLTMAAGVAGLSKVFTPEAADALSATGERLKGRLNRTGERHGVPVQVTGVGSILCMHFQRQPIRQPDDTAHTPAAARALFHLEMLARGFYVARRGFIALSLPLVESDYDAFADAFDDFLGACGPALGA